MECYNIFTTDDTLKQLFKHSVRQGNLLQRNHDLIHPCCISEVIHVDG